MCTLVFRARAYPTFQMLAAAAARAHKYSTVGELVERTSVSAVKEMIQQVGDPEALLNCGKCGYLMSSRKRVISLVGDVHSQLCFPPTPILTACPVAIQPPPSPH